MNLTDVSKLNPKWLTNEIKFLKIGRMHYYIDERTASTLQGIYRIVKPIATARGKVFFICPYCQRIHGLYFRSIIKDGAGIWTCLSRIGKSGYWENHVLLDLVDIDLVKEGVMSSEERDR